MAPTFPERATNFDSRHRSRAAAVALASVVGLVVLAIPLAAPGPALVPGSAPDEPDWILGLYGDGFRLSAGLYLGLLYLAIVAWVGVWAGAGRLGSRAIWAIAAFALILFGLAPPLLSLDLFSYISYGRLGVEGFNPYEFVPSDLPTDPAAARVEDFRFTSSVYGPLFTLLSYPLAAVGPSFALWGLKAIATASIAALGLLTARLGRLRGVDPAAAAAFVVLNPLVLVHLVGGAHNDGLMATIAVAGVLAIASRRPLTAGTALVGAVAVKASAALYLPFAVLGSADRRRLLASLTLVGAALVAAALACFGSGAADALGVVSSNQDTVSRWSVPATTARITGIDVDALRPIFAVGYGIAVAGLLIWVARGADWIRAAAWASFGLLLATSSMLPWYLIWMLPLAAVSRDRPLQLAAIALTAFQAANSIPL